MNTAPAKNSAERTPAAITLPAFAPWWLDEDNWPVDVPHAVFFGRALQQMGAALIEGWDGREFAAVAAKPFPVPMIAAQGYVMNRWTPEEAARAHALVSRHDGPEGLPDLATVIHRLVNFGPRVTSAPAPHPTVRGSAIYGAAKRADPPEPDPAKAAEAERRAAAVREVGQRVRALELRAHEIVAALNAALPAFEGRAAKLRSVVTQACANGEVSTGYRGSDGVIYVLGANLTDGSKWNAEHAYLGPRFTTCKVDRLNPTTPPASAHTKRDHCWLYVERDSFNAFMARIERTANPPPTGKQAAIRELRGLCEAHAKGEGALPVGAAWRDDAQERFGIGPTAAKAAWGIVAAQYPDLSSMAGKPKRRREG